MMTLLLSPSRFLLALICLMLVQLSPLKAAELPAFQTTLRADHPLVGQIWSRDQNGFITPEAFLASLVSKDFILLGEKHDNPDHHALQAWTLNALTQKGRHFSGAFEMLRRDQAEPLAAYLKDHPTDAAGLGKAVNWEKTGWPDYAVYQPVFQAALDGGGAILPANPPRPLTMSVARQGFEALPETQRSAWAVDWTPDAPMTQGMTQGVLDGHCGFLPEEHAPAMVSAQRLKDGAMAAALIEAKASPEADGAALIAGSGHTRLDWGVPRYLGRLAPDASQAAVAFTEVNKDWSNPAQYAERWGGDGVPFDYLWFTPRLEEVDPCEKHREALERMKQKKSGKTE